MAQPLDPLTVQRLAYVRYLYREGVEQSGQPSPLRSRAITSFHDAVENFIGLAAQHLGVDLKKNADGSLTIRIQKDSPGKDKEANWLPAPNGPPYVVMRVYWPKKAVLNGTWRPPPVRRIK